MREIIETICVGGSGGEAKVLVQLRNVFPGIGGEIATAQTVAAALREELGDVSSGTGRRLFLKHVIMKKLDDYFCRTGKYTFPHIARPLGSLGKHNGEKEGYLYEWVHGEGTFPWAYREPDGSLTWVMLDEWNEFVSAFNGAGIGVGADITNADDGHISQNIIHELPKTDAPRLNLLWKRIDFGDRSLSIDYDVLKNFLVTASADLQKVLGIDRYDLMFRAHMYLAQDGCIEERELGMLEMLARAYRLSTLSHNKTYEVAIR